MKYILVGWGIGLALFAALQALSLHWLVLPTIGLLAAVAVVGQLTVWYREGWRLRWPPGKR